MPLHMTPKPAIVPIYTSTIAGDPYPEVEPAIGIRSAFRMHYATVQSRLHQMLKEPGMDIFTDWIDSLDWAQYLDDEERSQLIYERNIRMHSSMPSDTGETFAEWLAVWKLRASTAKMYSTPLTSEQQIERNAWATIQDDALDDVFAVEA